MSKSTSDKNSYKGILSVVGGCLHQAGLDYLFIIENLIVYRISYLKQFDNDNRLTLEHGYFLSPICCLMMTLFTFLGGIIDHYCGVRLTTLLGTVIILIGSILLYYSTNVYYDYVIMVIYGLGFGISCMSTINNACYYYSKKQGIITTVINACGNLGGAIYNYAGSLIINPKQLQPNDKGFYSIAIGNRFKVFIMIHMISLIIITFISTSCIYQYRTNDKESDTPLMSINNTEKDEVDSLVKKKTREENEYEYKKNLRKAMYSVRIWMLFLLFFCLSFGQNIIATTFTTFGSINNVNVTTLSLSTMAYSLIACFIGPLWGGLLDRIGFTMVCFIVNISSVVISCIIYFIPRIGWLYGSAYVIAGALSCGTYAIIFPHLITVFKQEYASEMYGIVIFSTGISNLISAVFAFIFINVTRFDSPYMVIYLLAAGLSCISLVIGLFEDSEQFDYHNTKIKHKNPTTSNENAR